MPWFVLIACKLVVKDNEKINTKDLNWFRERYINKLTVSELCNS